MNGLQMEDSTIIPCVLVEFPFECLLLSSQAQNKPRTIFQELVKLVTGLLSHLWVFGRWFIPIILEHRETIHAAGSIRVAGLIRDALRVTLHAYLSLQKCRILGCWDRSGCRRPLGRPHEPSLFRRFFTGWQAGGLRLLDKTFRIWNAETGHRPFQRPPEPSPFRCIFTRWRVGGLRL